MKKYAKMTAMLLLYSAIYLGLLQVLSMLYFMTLVNVPMLKELTHVTNNEGVTQVSFPMFHLFSDAIILPVFFLVFLIFKKQNLFMAVRFNYKNLNVQNISIIFVLCLFASFFTAGMMKISWSKDLLIGMNMLLNTRLLDQPVGLFIIWLPLHCAIFREILFRGIVYNECKTGMPLIMAIIMQGLMQGLYFFQFGKMDLVINSMISCVFMVLIYEFTDSLWASIIAQVFLETLLFIWKNTGYAFFTPQTAGLFMGAAIIVLTGGFLFLREYEINRRKKVEQNVA